MKLLISTASPFVRIVRVLIREGGVSGVEEVPVATTPFETSPDVAAANPLGKIPALVRDDGATLYDSRVICRFLDTRGRRSLYPENRLWEVLTLEATAHGMAEALVLMTYEARFKGTDGKFGEWIEAQWAKAERAMDALEARWMSHLSGPVDMGVLATACALSYSDFRHPERDWRSARPALADWHEKISQTPALSETVPE